MKYNLYRKITEITSFRRLPSNYVVIDLETTGTDVYNDEIVQIAAVKYKNYEEVDRFNEYVKPENTIPKSAIKVHDITDEKVKDAPPIKSVLSPFFDFLGDDTIVGHNVKFDLDMLSAQRLKSHIGGEYIHFKYVDTLYFIRRYLKDEYGFFLKSYKLEDLNTLFNFGLENHNALNDCLMIQKLYQVIRHLILIDNFEKNVMQTVDSNLTCHNQVDINNLSVHSNSILGKLNYTELWNELPENTKKFIYMIDTYNLIKGESSFEDENLWSILLSYANALQMFGFYDEAALFVSLSEINCKTIEYKFIIDQTKTLIKYQKADLT